MILTFCTIILQLIWLGTITPRLWIVKSRTFFQLKISSVGFDWISCAWVIRSNFDFGIFFLPLHCFTLIFKHFYSKLCSIESIILWNPKFGWFLLEDFQNVYAWLSKVFKFLTWPHHQNVPILSVQSVLLIKKMMDVDMFSKSNWMEIILNGIELNVQLKAIFFLLRMPNGFVCVFESSLSSWNRDHNKTMANKLTLDISIRYNVLVTNK